MKKIIINKNLKFSSDDLTQYVDATKSFKLIDVFNCIKNSKVSIVELKKILKCGYLEEYIDEVNKKNKPAKSDIRYLEVYRTQDINNESGEKILRWNFHGIGTADEIGCTKYGLDFTPLYKIAHLEVRISNITTRYDLPIKNKGGVAMVAETKFVPLIMLVELLHTIVWELSWNGSILNRDAKM